jgi:hypothetical protein
LRAPIDTIPAPPFLTHLRWVNVKSLRMDRQLGRPVLIEFWDFCRPNSIRTLPYLKDWHERYSAGDAQSEGLQVVGIHSPGFVPSRERGAVEEAVARLEIAYPVLLDPDLEMWREYENRGWPARYLFDGRGMLFDYHYGEGAYRETELAIQELLGIEREPLAPLRPEDAPEALLAPQSEDREGAYSGPYEAGGVWAVLDGAGVVRVNDEQSDDGRDRGATSQDGGVELTVANPGAYPLIRHERHTAGVLAFEVGAGVECLATCFTPGIA